MTTIPDTAHMRTEIEIERLQKRQLDKATLVRVVYLTGLRHGLEVGRKEVKRG